RRRAFEVLLEDFKRRALERALRDRVLHDLVAALRDTQLATQVRDLRNRQAFVVQEDSGVRSLEGLLELFQLEFFVRSGNRHQCFTTTSTMCVVSIRTPGPIVDDRVTLLRYLPLAAAGLALTMLSTSACALATSEPAANDILPTGAWMIP